MKLYIREVSCLLVLITLNIIKPMLAGKHSKKYWLIGENHGDILKDNGYYLYKYCMDNDIDNVYFIIKKNTKNTDKQIMATRNILIYGSLKHLKILVFSRVLLYTHTHRDIIYHWIFVLLFRNRTIVFLKHGVTSFKKFNSDYVNNIKEVDLLVTVSDYERSIVLDNIAIAGSKVKVTGFSRYDYLKNNTNNNHISILYMPTWRDWINENNINKSLYFERTLSLINNEKLHQLLTKYDVYLIVYFHIRMSKYITMLAPLNNRIQLIPYGGKSVHELLCTAQLLVTDYSSVSWDFYYLDKPTIFYRYDINEYQSKRGSYIGLDTNVFGTVVNNEDELLESIVYFIKRGFKLDNKYIQNKHYYFKHFDTNNSKRILAEIINLVGKG